MEKFLSNAQLKEAFSLLIILYFRFANGDVFEGFFVNGKRQGNGILVYSNGTRREGEWKRGKLHGLVFLHRATITTVERWDNGVLMDRGRNATEAASSQGY